MGPAQNKLSARFDPARAEPPAEFAQLVRNALACLYEPSRLFCHPLNTLLAGALPQLGDPALNLRTFLLDAIESLEPGHPARVDEREKRPYLILVDRYVGGFSIKEILSRLHIRERQFRREHHEALEALVACLWARYRECMPAADGSAIVAASPIQAELENLGLQLETLSLADLLASVQPAVQAIASRCGASLRFSMPTQNLRCLCDRILTRQALLSCVSVLLSQHPSHLEVSALGLHRGCWLQVSVKPTLAPEKTQELGQELAACQALMAVQGSSLSWLRCEDGSCFGVRLSFRGGATVHVLAVDDNERMLRLYERYLAGGSYTVTTARSAEQAEACLQAVRPDVIILDVMMRQVDGWELLQRLHSISALRGVPIIVCSVLNEPNMALALGAQAYLRKPISVEELLGVLNRLLDESSQVAPHPVGQ
jgi:CheY-like chemotaxis protein